jgi:L-amino acid N-acyltransferase YncA
MNASTDYTVTPLHPADWPMVRDIHAEGIATGDATFETSPPDSWKAWSAGKPAEGCLALRQGSELVGWAALLPVSGRCVYRGVAEVSLYIRAQQRGHGLGSLLLGRLIERAEELGYWTLQAGIFPENSVSLALHRKHGFRVVGIRERLGRMEYGPNHGRWRDVVLMERRSLRVGID